MSPAPASADCPLCQGEGGLVLQRHADLRIVRVTGADAADFPAFYRVIWNAHVAEWSDLGEVEQLRCMRAVTAVERVLRERLQPVKVNLAALGNLVPHLHWHIVARFDWDSHFPGPIWAPARQPVQPGALAQLQQALPGCDEAVAALAF